MIDFLHPGVWQTPGCKFAELVENAKIRGENLNFIDLYCSFVSAYDTPYSGPIYKSMYIERKKIRLFFDCVDDGLIFKGLSSKNVKGNPVCNSGFAIAGADRKFRWAKAKIEGETVVVWRNDIPAPVAVRYAWASNPVCCLYNGAGLPASPFRTDSWRGITEETGE